MRRGIWIIAACSVVGFVLSAGLAEDHLFESPRADKRPRFLKRTIDYFSRSGRSGGHTFIKSADDQKTSKNVQKTPPWSSASARSMSGSDLPSRYTRSNQSRPTSQTRKLTTQPNELPKSPATKNYYRELFGTNPPTSQRQSDSLERTPDARSAGPEVGASTFMPAAVPRAQEIDVAKAREPETNVPKEVKVLPVPKVSERTVHVVQPITPLPSADVPHSMPSAENTHPQTRAIQQVRASDDGLFPWAAADNDATPQNASPPQTPSLPTLSTATGPPQRAETILVQQEPDVSKRDAVSELRSRPRSVATANYSAAAPGISLKWVKQSEINVGQPCRVDLIVTNDGEATAENVVVIAYFPAVVRLTTVVPAPAESQDYLLWQFDTLAPGDKQIIEMTMIPSTRGDLDITALARFTASSSAVFTVEEPLLTLELQGPTEVMLGDPASQTATISNPGTGVLHHVVLEVQVPEGLEHPRGERLMMELGSLNPGELRTVRLTLAAVGGGQKTLEIQAHADSGLTQTVVGQINVVAPSLQIAVVGPGLRYVGRHASYTITVTNDGAAATNNVRVTHKLPEGFEFVHADNGGNYDADNRGVQWFVGRLDAGETKQLQVQLNATQLGNFTQRISATSEQAVNATTQIETRVDGTASLVLEVVDYDDPIEIGRETGYEVRVSNRGTKAARNVGLACELPAGVELIDVKGATAHVIENGSVTFQPLPQLAPNKTALFRFQMRGTVEGNHRIRARLASDSIQEPLVVDEMTRFYAD